MNPHFMNNVGGFQKSIMASRIVVSNLSRIDDYTLLLNGQPRGTVHPLQSDEINVEAGKYELSVQGENEEGLPNACKPIVMKIDKERTVRLNIEAKNLSIGIYDEDGTQLNAASGFLCGNIADGVYVENPIT
jgi:hypothetical protein